MHMFEYMRTGRWVLCFGPSKQHFDEELIVHSLNECTVRLVGRKFGAQQHFESWLGVHHAETLCYYHLVQHLDQNGFIVGCFLRRACVDGCIRRLVDVSMLARILFQGFLEDMPERGDEGLPPSPDRGMVLP